MAEEDAPGIKRSPGFTIADRCTVGPGGPTTSSILFADWRAFAEALGHDPGTIAAFCAGLTARGVRRHRSARRRGFSGIALASRRGAA